MTAPDKIEELTANLKEYINIRYKLLELKASDKFSAIGSKTISGFAIGMLGFLVVFFTSFGIGIYLSSLIGDKFSGFFVVAVFYFLLVLLIIIYRKKLMSTPIRNRIIKELFNEN